MMAFKFRYVPYMVTYVLETIVKVFLLIIMAVLFAPIAMIVGAIYGYIKFRIIIIALCFSIKENARSKAIVRHNRKYMEGYNES